MVELEKASMEDIVKEVAARYTEKPECWQDWQDSFAAFGFVFFPNDE